QPLAVAPPTSEPSLQSMAQQHEAEQLAAAERGLEEQFAPIYGAAPQRTLDAAANAGQAAIANAQALDDARVTVSSPNPQYPIAQRFQQEMLGREGTGEVTRVPKMRQVVQPDGSIGVEQETQLQQQPDGSIVEVPVFEDVVDTGDPGLLEKGKQAQAGALEARQREQQAIAARMWLRNEEDKALLANQQAAMQRRQELRDQQIEASRTADRRATDAARALAAQPDVDPNRYWANKSAGFKVGAALYGMFMGLAGKDGLAAIQS